MSKQSLNLSIEESIKQRAKKIARKKGISVSRFFEELVAQQEDPDVFIPTPGSAAYEISRIIPESEKVDDYDYNKLKWEMMQERYGDN